MNARECIAEGGPEKFLKREQYEPSDDWAEESPDSADDREDQRLDADIKTERALRSEKVRRVDVDATDHC